MQKEKIGLLVLGFAVIVPTLGITQPIINSAEGEWNDFGEVTISGSGFGQKIPAMPKYWSNFDNLPTGQIADGWEARTGYVAVTDSVALSGDKSLKFESYDGSFEQIVRDLGELLSPVTNRREYYFSASMYIWNNGVDADNTQYKMWTLSSEPVAYLSTGDTTKTAFISMPWYSSSNGGYWGNSPFRFAYNGGQGEGAYQVINCASDFMLWNQWQRIEHSIVGSSAPLEPDATFRIFRVGRSDYVVDAHELVSHDADDDEWRYTMLQGTWHTVGEPGGRGIMLLDDVYIDDTRARVEIGNAEVFGSCTQRAIQIPTSWSSDGTSIECSINISPLSEETDLWLFVVSASGVVSPGFRILSNSSPGQPSGVTLGIE